MLQKPESIFLTPFEGVVQQQGLARHGLLHERGQQRHPAVGAAPRRPPGSVRGHGRQPPAEPDPAAAHRGHRVSEAPPHSRALVTIAVVHAVHRPILL